MDNREMFEEINALIGAVAKAFNIEALDVVADLDQGRLALEMVTDDQGRNCVEVTRDGRVARIYPGAIFRPDDRPEAADDDDCDGGGCTCGH
ncbi:hypothetical protein [Magnetospirillum sp. SS-4]|uniref:hypothetical protein n=1 Tax=Magnetospirillum sp. SS-4 TaxID=2681465 RepID=UPI001383E2F2|nr:hypothetical protein [Magnetospirillum sp. SS-4]CAA7619425.1 conserved hypothetical protein [Magnetospirillum sp. SS-4]